MVLLTCGIDFIDVKLDEGWIRTSNVLTPLQTLPVSHEVKAIMSKTTVNYQPLSSN